ncbi:unnamed protein product [Amoebophrya sp. A120]|nr:unnamed protein product [Amoebophrya sp. A120]|eukprot:GSA120T00021766001.1
MLMDRRLRGVLTAVVEMVVLANWLTRSWKRFESPGVALEHQDSGHCGRLLQQELVYNYEEVNGCNAELFYD